MLKLLVDESSGIKLFRFLVENGFDAKFVGEIAPMSSDIDVLKMAEDEKRILITNDKDFGELVFRMNKPCSGIILLRLEKDSPSNRQRHVSAVIGNFSEKLHGSFIVVSENQTRIRKM